MLRWWTYTWFVVWLFYASPAWGQSDKRQSLHNQIDSISNHCETIYPTLQLAATFYGLSPDSMLHWGEVALVHARRCQQSEARMKCHNLLGVCYLSQAQYRPALAHFLQAYHLADSLGNQRAVSKSLNNLGVIYWHQEAYDKALDIYFRAANLIDSSRDSALLAHYYYNIGMIYQDHRKRLDSAQLYYERALTISTHQADTVGQVDVHNSLGLLNLKRGQRTEASYHFHQAVSLAQPQGKADQLFYPLYNLARLLLREGRHPEAQTMASQALTLAEQTHSYDMLQSSYALQAALDSINGQHEASLQHLKLHIRYLDSLRQTEHDAEIQDMQARFELAESQQQNAMLRQRESQQAKIIQTQSMGLLAGMIASGVMAALVLTLIILYRQRRQALEQLQAAGEDKDALMSIVAHDLKAPLSNIREMANLMLESGKDPIEVHQMALMMLQEARRGENLVRNLLDFEAISQGKRPPKRESIELTRLLVAICDAYQPLATAKQLSLHWSSNLHEVPVYTDPTYLTRILDNLLTNAIKYSPRDKCIYLRLVESKAGLHIHVEDEGPGISQADQARLFQPYERLPNRPTNGESSTGLGLSIVQGLSQALGIGVSVSSELGKGATFSLLLPAHLQNGPIVHSSRRTPVDS